MARWAMTASLMLWAFSDAPSLGQQIHRQTFEGNDTRLSLGLTNDPQVELLDHSLSTDTVHSGKQAERFVVRLTSGSFCHVDYAVPKCLVFEELAISAWVRANRPGTQILARVVLPRVKDLKTGKPAVTLLRGAVYEVSGRWRRLVVRRPDLLLENQQMLLQAERKEKVDVAGAYIDAIVFNIHSGLGDVEVYFDDVNMGPIVPVAKPAPTPAQPTESVPLALRNEQRAMPKVQVPSVRNRADKNRPRVVGSRLQVGNRPFFIRGIRQSRAPLGVLKEAGFNTLFVDWPVGDQLAQASAQYGMQVVPMLPITGRDNRAALPAAHEVMSPQNRGLAIYVGNGLDRASEPMIRAAVRTLRAADEIKDRPVTGEVEEGFAAYSNRFDMIGTRRYPLMTSLSLKGYRQWLKQRVNISRPGTHFWTEIQTHPPEDFCRVAYGHAGERRFHAPVGPQPEQIKLLTFASLASGYKGVVFSTDRALGESYFGRDRLLQMALLNLELTLIEPFIADGKVASAKTSNSNVSAVSFTHRHGVMVLPYWSGPNTQFVVGQSSLNDLKVLVTDAPEASQAYQISACEVRGLERRPGITGLEVTVPEFDLNSFILLTTDTTIVDRYQKLVQQVKADAAAWQVELTELQLAKTEEINARLEQSGHPAKQAPRLLIEARRHLENSREQMQRGRSRLAFLEAARSLRIARTLQHVHWSEAVKDLAHPVVNPFAASFYTLPEFYQFQMGVEQASFGANQVVAGDFERDGKLDSLGWTYSAHSADPFEMSALLVGDDQAEGQRSLKLSVAPKDPEARVLVVDNTLVEIVTPPIPVRPGQIARISGKVRLPRGVQGSVDGAMVWDTIGGKTLGLRFHAPGKWKEFVFYRPINRSAELQIHLATTGLGDVLFDDVQVQLSDNGTVPVAGQQSSNLLR